jgi:hypothetical protein
MPTKTGDTRPRGTLGLTSHVPSSTIEKRPGKVDRIRQKSRSIKSAKPPRVGRRER